MHFKIPMSCIILLFFFALINHILAKSKNFLNIFSKREYFIDKKAVFTLVMCYKTISNKNYLFLVKKYNVNQ